MWDGDGILLIFKEVEKKITSFPRMGEEALEVGEEDIK